ncbi:MAG: sorbosone dehydrogenase family protein [Vicinamibacterales bacterium]
MVGLWRGMVVALLALSVGACERESPSRGDDEALTGNERIGWDQAAESLEELGALRYGLWVDGEGDFARDVTCSALIDGLASCSGALPTMSPGTHVLEMATVLPDGRQSARSTPLTVTVGGSGRLVFGGGLDGSVGSSPTSGSPSPRAVAGVAVDLLGGPLADPTDLAVADDGRVLIVERAGAVRQWAENRRDIRSILVLDDVLTTEGTGLLSIAFDPDHARNHFVYLAYTAASGFRIARYRESEGSLAERAIVFETAADPAYTAAVLRFGPDRRLYVALDDQGDSVRSGDLGSYSGKVLRLTPDGAVPDDQPGYTPVWLPDLRSPRGLDWIPQSDLLWLADGGGDRGMLLAARIGPVPPRRASVASRVALRVGEIPSGAQIYRGDVFRAWQGQLLIGLNPAGQLLRLHLDPTDPSTVSASSLVLETDGEPVRAIGVDAPGNILIVSGARLLRLSSAASVERKASVDPAFVREPTRPPPTR